MAFIRYPRNRAGLLFTMAVCVSVLAHASVLTNKVPSYSVDTASHGSPAAPYASPQCKQQCDLQAARCNLTCSQGSDALQCSQQCTNQWQQCTSAC